MSITFAEMGTPFPRFAAPVEEAVEYSGRCTCVACGARAFHTFSLGIGRHLVAPCPGCQAEVGLDSVDRRGETCPRCNTFTPWPTIPEQDLLVCYTCLRDGRAVLTKDTEFGMLSWEQVLSGVSHGLPGGLPRNDFEAVQRDEGWVGARIPIEHITELLRTPSFHTIQGEIWLFCCREPMVYLGAWSRDRFSERAPDGDGEAFFNRVVERVIHGLWRDELHDDTGVYVFQCRQCKTLRANWDLA